MDLFHDLNDKWSFSHVTLTQILDDFMPLHQVSFHHSKRPTPWFTDHISHLISLKNKAKRKAYRTGDPTDRVSYSRMKNYLKDAVRQAKVNYLESLVSKSRRVPGRAAEVWSYVNAMFGHTKLSVSTAGPWFLEFY